MQSILLSRECGEDACGLEDVLWDSWARLKVDDSRQLTALFAESLCFLDIDTPAGSLLLCGGTGLDARSGQTCGSVAVFRLATAREKAAKDPTVFAVDEKIASDTLNCGKWLPGDPGLFVTGSSGNEVSVWDTTCFKVALRIPLGGDDGEVSSVALSSVPGARTELVATASTDSPDIALLDLGSGSSTHRLQGHSGHVTDIAWSSTNPYLLASCATDGGVRLFDVRRAGHVACLIEFDEYRKLPYKEWEFAEHRELFEEHPTKRARSSRDFSASSSSMLVHRGTSPVLGLGCAWESASAPQQRRRKRRSEASIVKVRSRAPVSKRVRFTSDGTRVISGRNDRTYSLWDVHTGRLLATHRDGDRRRDGKVVFEVARDNCHLFSNGHGWFRTYGLDSGVLLSQRPGHVRDMSEMVVHPIYEEVYTASESQIFCWSPSASSEQ